MYKIDIFRSTARQGSLLFGTHLKTLYEPEVPDDIDEIVDELEGDFYEVVFADRDREGNHGF